MLASLLLLTPAGTSEVTSAEARAVAKETYIYGFPLVDSYRIQNAYVADRASPEYKAPYNRSSSVARVSTPQDTVIQTPNSDTPLGSRATGNEAGIVLIEPNWLASPSGPFVAFMRLYWPNEEALEGKWRRPPMVEAT
jgi:hypothetical protein